MFSLTLNEKRYHAYYLFYDSSGYFYFDFSLKRNGNLALRFASSCRVMFISSLSFFCVDKISDNFLIEITCLFLYSGRGNSSRNYHSTVRYFLFF